MLDREIALWYNRRGAQKATALAKDRKKFFLNFFQKPIDKPVKAWYISIIKRGKSPIQKGTWTMNKDFYELFSAQYEENNRVLETLALADELGVSYEDAEAFIADMATNPYGD